MRQLRQNRFSPTSRFLAEEGTSLSLPGDATAVNDGQFDDPTARVARTDDNAVDGASTDGL